MKIKDSKLFLPNLKNLVESDDTNKIVEILRKDLEFFISYLSSTLNRKFLMKFDSIELDNIDDSIRVDFGTKLEGRTLYFGKWLFDYPERFRESMLLFLIVKTSFSQFIPSIERYYEATEFINNIITILWLKKNFNIRSLDNRIIADIRSKIFPDEIAGKGDIFWNNLLNLSFVNEIQYELVFKSYLEMLENGYHNNLKLDELVNNFYDWTIEKIDSPEEIIAPIFLTNKLYNVVQLLYELGYEKSTTSNIAKILNVHQNTIVNVFGDLLGYYSTYWRPILNLEKMNLHNYIFTMELTSTNFLGKISNELLSIPYLKTLYRGRSDIDKEILYSPSLICPHYVSDLVNEKLKFWESKGFIKNYNLQLMRSRKMFHAITTSPFNTSIKNYERILKDKKEDNIKKFLFSNEIVDFSTEFDAENPAFDFNILYFLSILRNKFLLKARYGVIISELPELYERNNIDSTNTEAQTDFLNQLEIRARRRELITYSLYISSFKRGTGEILLLEIPTENTNEEAFNEIQNKIRIFSFIAQINLYNRYLLTLPGITHEHKIAQILKDIFKSAGFEVNLYTIQLLKSKMIPLHKLYNFEEKKWFLGLEK